MGVLLPQALRMLVYPNIYVLGRNWTGGDSVVDRRWDTVVRSLFLGGIRRLVRGRTCELEVQCLNS